jgi:hypothetical protein
MTAARRRAAILAVDFVGCLRPMGDEGSGASRGVKREISCVKPKSVLYPYHSPDRTHARRPPGEEGQQGNAVVTFEAQCDTGTDFIFGFAVTH